MFSCGRDCCGREQAIKAAAGFVRIEVESALSRGGRGGNNGGFHVAGGNYFSAKPIGVRNGLDYGCSGEVRKVEADRIRYAKMFHGCFLGTGGGILFRNVFGHLMPAWWGLHVRMLVHAACAGGEASQVQVNIYYRKVALWGSRLPRVAQYTDSPHESLYCTYHFCLLEALFDVYVI